MTPPTCRVTMAYTVDDDGIHLWCMDPEHGDLGTLGFDPTPSDAARQAAEHVAPVLHETVHETRPRGWEQPLGTSMGDGREGGGISPVYADRGE